MAYCDRCGSYIPDGWTACPACGYDKEQEEKQTQQAAQAQAYQEQQEKYAREEAEKRRAQRQAYDKVWAENEQRRRKEEEELRRRQKEQEERARREQEERARREQEERRRQEQSDKVHVYVDADGRKNIKVGDRIHVVVNPDGSKKVEVDGKTHEYDSSDRSFDVDFGKAGEKVRDFLNSDAVNRAEETFSNAGGKVLPILSYLGPLCFVPLILGSDDFTRFHARQGLRLFLTGAILSTVASFFGIGFAIIVFQILMSILGIKNVLNGEKKKLPYIGG